MDNFDNFGEFFWPIDEAQIDGTPHKVEHPWTTSVCEVLRIRIQGMMKKDAYGFVDGLLDPEQPQGRYAYWPDVIRLWNASQGYCVHCRCHIYLNPGDLVDAPPHKDLCQKEACSGWDSHVACVARNRSNIMHLAENCVAMSCNSCNSIIGPVRPVNSVCIPCD